MSGTIVCGVNESQEARAAAQLAGVLAHRLGLRLVLAQVVEVPEAHGSATVGRDAGDAERTLETIANELAGRVSPEARLMFGDRAALLAQVAAEEGADLIVLGARTEGLRGRRLRYGLARELEAATPTPVLLATADSDERGGRRVELSQV